MITEAHYANVSLYMTLAPFFPAFFIFLRYLIFFYLFYQPIMQSHYANVSLYDPGTLAPPGLPTIDPWGQTFVYVKEIIIIVIVIIIIVVIIIIINIIVVIIITIINDTKPLWKRSPSVIQRSPERALPLGWCHVEELLQRSTSAWRKIRRFLILQKGAKIVPKSDPVKDQTYFAPFPLSFCTFSILNFTFVL